tara:strand:+ start:1371 stop:1571 length:201 start_codon:yes stop_codon:yes gene_type:complete
MTRNYTNLSKNQSSTEGISNNQVKTTDVNILLNRVRLDKKQNLKKKILLSLLFIGLVCSITILLII